MSNIDVSGLRRCECDAWNDHGYCARGEEAADEIERLRGLLTNSEMTVKEIMADNERLRASSADEVLSLRQEIRELLAALQAMVRAYGNHDDAHTREVRAEAKAAVARAKA